MHATGRGEGQMRECSAARNEKELQRWGGVSSSKLGMVSGAKWGLWCSVEVGTRCRVGNLLQYRSGLEVQSGECGAVYVEMEKSARVNCEGRP